MSDGEKTSNIEAIREAHWCLGVGGQAPDINWMRDVAALLGEIDRLEDRVRLLETAIEAVPADPAIGEWWDQHGDLLGEIHQGVTP